MRTNKSGGGCVSQSGLWVLAALLALAAPAVAGAQPEDAPTHQQRLERWDDARFGMFIHWGISAIPAGVWKGKPYDGYAEWLMKWAGIPVEEYEKLSVRFNPVEFDAERWVKWAKRGGMKYLVITAKHHDGFCMFDSRYTAYDVVDATPFGRDVLKELAAACEKHGLEFGFYYSVMDWHHYDYVPRGDWQTMPRRGADLDRYQTYLERQVRELLTGYGDPAILWFDGEWEDSWTTQRGEAVKEMIRGLQPNVLINNRLWKRQPDKGDFGTPEQEIPAGGVEHRWETCMTMNDSWGHHQLDQNWKSARTLVHNLVETASKGGNYLLNVGPKANGRFPHAAVVRLKKIGRWLDTHGPSIYGTEASPIGKPGWGRATVKRTDGETALYLHVLDWPEGGTLTVPRLTSGVASAKLLGTDEKLNAARKDGRWRIHLPDDPSNEIDSVIKLTLEGELQTEQPDAEQAG